MTQKERLLELRKAKDPLYGLIESIQLVKAVKGEKGDKGDKGDVGPSPVKYVDYFTQEEVALIVEHIQSLVKDGEPGEKGDQGEPGLPGEPGKTPVLGVDYFTKKDKEDIVKKVLSEVKVEPGKSPKIDDIVSKVLKEIKLPNQEQLVLKSELAEFLRRGGFRGGGDTVAAGTGISISVNANGQKEISATGSGSFSILTTVSTIDDSNTTFVFASAPSMVNINGFFYNAGATSGGVVMWTNVGGTVTTANPVGTGGCIFAIA